MDYLHPTLTAQTAAVLPRYTAIAPTTATLRPADTTAGIARIENIAPQDSAKLVRKPLPSEQTLKPYGTLMLPYRGEDSTISVLA